MFRAEMYTSWPADYICTRTAEVFERTMKDTSFFSYMMNQLRVLKSGKHYLSFNGLRAYCVGRDSILKILQSEKHKLRNGKSERGHPVVYIRFV